MANYVVIARFDDETNHKLIELQKTLVEKGYKKAISEWPPHITIAAYEDVDIDKLCAWADEFSKDRSQFNVMFISLGILPPGGEHTETAVLYAAPASSKELIDFYYGFHEKFDDHCGNLGWWYSAKCGQPVIHSTIGIFEIKTIQNSLEIILSKQIFGQATIEALEIYTYPMKLIKRVELDNGKKITITSSLYQPK